MEEKNPATSWAEKKISYGEKNAQPPQISNGPSLITIATVAEEETSFCETYLATEVRKNFTKPTILHGESPAETCFAAQLHTSFSWKLQHAMWSAGLVYASLFPSM